MLGRSTLRPALAAALCVMIALGGCSRDFDDEYAQTEAQIDAKAKQLDAELSKQMQAEIGEDGSEDTPGKTR